MLAAAKFSYVRSDVVIVKMAPPRTASTSEPNTSRTRCICPENWSDLIEITCDPTVNRTAGTPSG